MSQRDSGYARVAFDQYETPEWVTRALLPYIPKDALIWEPACGSGKMARVLNADYRSDIQTGTDFLACAYQDFACVDAIITNPPYTLATEFITHALEVMRDNKGFVAMLLRTDFDHAKSRKRLFADCPAFCEKLILTKRIQWFEDSKSSPSFNHAWFIWDWRNKKAPTISYHFED
jgi:hypothetical protein